MNSERVLSVVLAACCLFALGASATTLDSSVDTTPDDAINSDFDILPLSPDDVRNLKEQAKSKGAGDLNREGGSAPPDSNAQDRQTGQESTGESDAGGSADDPGDSGAAGGGSQPGPIPAEPSLLERLLSLLQALVNFLLSLLPVVVALGLAAAAVRYRDRIRRSLSRLGGGAAGRGAEDDGTVASPANDVEAAWYEMLRRIGVDDARTQTPRECASEAIEAGVDPTVVESLTTTFERVTYGGEPVTDRRRSQVQRDVRRLREQTDRGPVR